MFENKERWQFAKILIILIFTILTVLAIPLTLLITSLTLILRQVGKFYAHNFHKDSKQILKIVNHTSQLIARDHLRPNPRFNIIYTWFGKGTMTIEELREIINTKVVEKRVDGKLFYPELQCHTVGIGGYDFWKYNSQFSINGHVRELDQNSCEKKKGITGEELKEVLADLINAPWKKGRSPWEFILVKNYLEGKDPKVAVIFRVHHFLADGYCILKLTQCLNSRSEETKGFTEQRNAPTDQRGIKNIIRKIALIFLLPFHTALLLEQLVRIERSCWKVPPESRSKIGQKVLQDWTPSLSVETLKTIKNKHGVSFTSVLLSLIVAAMHSLNQSMGQDVPKIVTAILMAPLPGHPGGLSNHFGYVVVRLPTGEKDPVRRLHLVERELSSLKTSLAPLISHLLYSLGGLLPPSMTMPLLPVGIGYSVALSIMAGPGAYDWGNCVHSEGLYSIGTGQGDTGACFTGGTQSGLARITLTIDRLIFSSENAVRKLNEIVQTEIKNLLAAVRAE